MSPPHLFKIINHDYSWDAYDADRLGDDEDDDLDEDDTTSFPLMPKKMMLMHTKIILIMTKVSMIMSKMSIAPFH